MPEQAILVTRLVRGDRDLKVTMSWLICERLVGAPLILFTVARLGLHEEPVGPGGVGFVRHKMRMIPMGVWTSTPRQSRPPVWNRTGPNA